jgi:hypothetical protein
VRLRAANRIYLDMADRSRRNPRNNFPDLVLRQRRVLRSAQNGKNLRSRSPAFLVPDQREVQGAAPAYTGS